MENPMSSVFHSPHQIQLEKKNLPSNPPTLHPKLKKKKTKAPLRGYCTSHWLDEISLLQKVCHNEHPMYVGEKGRILGKTYGFEISVIGNTFGEHIENLGNNLETC
jgi:hypothetical protein